MNTELISQIASAAELILQLEGIIVALATIVFGKQAVTSYQQNKYRLTLHSAIETAIGFAKAQGLSPISPEGLTTIQGYVKTTGASDAVASLMKGQSDGAVNAQIAKMVMSKVATQENANG